MSLCAICAACRTRRNRKKRFKRIQHIEPKVKIGEYEAKQKAKRERAAQLKAQLDTMEQSFARLPELTPRVARTTTPHYITRHGHGVKRSGRRRRLQQTSSTPNKGETAATGSTPRAALSGGGTSARKGHGNASGRNKNVRSVPNRRTGPLARILLVVPTSSALRVRLAHLGRFLQNFLCAAQAIGEKIREL